MALLNFSLTNFSLHLVSCLVGHDKNKPVTSIVQTSYDAITNVEEVSAYQSVCKLFCVEMWSSTPKLFKI